MMILTEELKVLALKGYPEITLKQWKTEIEKLSPRNRKAIQSFLKMRLKTWDNLKDKYRVIYDPNYRKN